MNEESIKNKIKNLSVNLPEMNISFDDILHFLIKEIVDAFAKETFEQSEKNIQVVKDVMSQMSILQTELIQALQNNKEIYNSFVELQGKYKTILAQYEKILQEHKELTSKYSLLAEEKRKLDSLNVVRNKK